MYEFIVGERDIDQVEDNLFYLKSNGVARLDYHLKEIPSYSRLSNFESFDVPPEIWEKIFDITCKELIQEANFKILARLLQVSKAYMNRVYRKFFGRDTLVCHKVTDRERYFRISHTLALLNSIVSRVYNTLSNRFELRMDPRCGIFPNPWEIVRVCTLQLNHHPTIYAPKKEPFNPHRYQIGQGVAFLDGEITNSVLRAPYMRIPTIILRTTGPRGINFPIMSPLFLNYSQSWRTVATFLSTAFGPALGVYHAIGAQHLPDELIFHGEVIMET